MKQLDVIRCADKIEETTKPLLERLWKGIFKKPIRAAMGFGIITRKPMEIQKSNNKIEEGANAIQKFIKAMTNINEITKITQKEVQPHMVKQLLLPPSSQLGLGNLSIFVLGNKQNPWWKMDQKYIFGRKKS